MLRTPIKNMLYKYLHSKYPYKYTYIFTDDPIDWLFIRKCLNKIKDNKNIRDFGEIIEISLEFLNQEHILIFTKQDNILTIITNAKHSKDQSIVIDTHYLDNCIFSKTLIQEEKEDSRNEKQPRHRRSF